MNYFWWKLGREIKRLGQQLRSVPEFFVEPIRQKRHDALRPITLKQSIGQVQPSLKVVLLLIYQPSGLSSSTLWTCEHFVKKGYAPLVISNAPISAEDLRLLEPVTWRVVERPNFGYDFGGYRDGIWLLDQWSVLPQNLIIINDSIWFPLSADDKLIVQMEQSSADYVGAFELQPTREVYGADKKKRPFYGSFFFMLKRPALAHPVFKDFWTSYKITSNKYKTIRRGERGFSHAMFTAGISSKAIFSRQNFDSYVNDLTSLELKALLISLVTIDDRLVLAQKNCISSYQEGSIWNASALKLVFEITEKQNILATAPLAALKIFQVPYLKKSKDWNNLKALALITQDISEGNLKSVPACILSEIKSLSGS
jgi:hypothetical protein